MVVNGLPVDFTRYKNIPVAIMAAANTIKPSNGGHKEEKIMNAEQLKTEQPDIYNQIYNVGVAAERERIKGIDSIRAAGYEAIKNKAKYETFDQAGNVAVDIINAQAARVTGVANNLASDIQVSNVNDIPMGDAPALEPGAEATAAKNLIQKAIDAANANIQGR